MSKAERKKQHKLHVARDEAVKRALPIFPGDAPARQKLRVEFAAIVFGGQTTAQALDRAFDAHTALMAMARQQTNAVLACKEGCCFCCHEVVEVGREEASAVARTVRKSFEGKELEDLRERIRANAKLAHGKRAYEYSLRCAFLVEDRCSIYSRRPFGCRQAHSADASKCKEALERPTEAIGIPRVGMIDMAGMQVRLAFREACVAVGAGREEGYELHQAVDRLLEDPDADLAGTEVPESDADFMQKLKKLNPRLR